MQRILAAAQLSRYQFQTTCDACGGKLRVENALKMSIRDTLATWLAVLLGCWGFSQLLLMGSGGLVATHQIRVRSSGVIHSMHGLF
jgi:hypothetical protein